MTPTLTLHALPPSHPCMTVRRALELKGLEFEEVTLDMRGHTPEVQAIYGEDKTTVPGMLIDGEPVHGSRAILARLDELVPEPQLLSSDAVREAEAWGDEVLQDLGRRLPWGALHFRPEMMGLLGGQGQLDPKGTGYAMRFVAGAWAYHKISAVQLHEDLQALPGHLDHVDALIADGTLGGEQANAGDLQIGATLYVLGIVGDLAPLLRERPCSEMAARWFGEQDAAIPAGAYPAGWVPAAA